MTAIAAAVAAHQAGDHAGAEAAYRAILAHQPDHPDALNFLGLVLANSERLAEGVELLERSLALAPGNGVYWGNRATVYQQQGPGHESAVEACLRRSAELQPTSAGAQVNLATYLHARKRHAEALTFLDLAQAIDPADAGFWLLTAQLRLEARRPADALPLLEQALAARPEDVAALQLLAHALKALGRRDEALAAATRAVALAPDSADAAHTLGNVHAHFWEHATALGHYERAIALAPDKPELYQNLAVLHGDRHDLDAVEAALGQALALRPDERAWRAQLGMAYLQHGYYEEGWSGLDFRARSLPALACPEWHGEPIAGKRVLFVGEQGSGDHLQFVRFALDLVALGAIVDVMTSEPLAALLGRMPGVRRVAHVFDQEPYDYWTLGMSAPRWLAPRESALARRVPYLAALPEEVAAWQAQLGAIAGARRKVGLVWAGNPEHGRDPVRSMALADLAPLAAVPGVAWFSLQKGYAEAQLAEPPAGLAIHDLAPALTDFGATAAIMQALDLVIAVDTSSAHLAGALGVPVWVMLCAVPDWRWLLARADSPWYPSARLFRQARPLDWAPLVADVAAALSPASSPSR